MDNNMLDQLDDIISTAAIDEMIESLLNDKPDGNLNLVNDLPILDEGTLDSLLEILGNQSEEPIEQNIQPKIIVKPKVKKVAKREKKVRDVLKPSVKPKHRNKKDKKINVLDGAQFFCSLCNYKTTRRDLIKRHSIRHVNYLYQCDSCLYQTRFKHHFKNHKKNKHFEYNII